MPNVDLKEELKSILKATGGGEAAYDLREGGRAPSPRRSEDDFFREAESSRPRPRAQEGVGGSGLKPLVSQLIEQLSGLLDTAEAIDRALD